MKDMGRAQGKVTAVVAAGPQGGARKRTVWTDERIEQALRTLAAGQDTFPTTRQFSDAGLEGLRAVLARSDRLDEWARRLGLTRLQPGTQTKWTDANIETELRRLCAGRDIFPSLNEFRAAGLYGLYQLLQGRKELDLWARRLGLPRRTVSAPVHEREQVKTPGGDLGNRLKKLVGVDLRHVHLARTGTAGSERSKSWAHHTVRALLGPAAEGLPIRTVPARVDDAGNRTITSTMPLAPVDPDALATTSFADSGIPAALEDLIVIVREDEPATPRARSRVLDARRFCLAAAPELLKQLEADYAAAQAVVMQGGELTGDIGELMQPRTKGLGGEVERTFAFYARPALIDRMLARSDSASDSAAEFARRVTPLPRRRPTEQQLQQRLERFMRTWTGNTFPNAQAFEAAGEDTLFWELRNTKDITAWAAQYGYGWRGSTAVWSGKRVEAELEQFLAGRATWPKRGEFDNAGVAGRRLLKRVEMYGGKQFWARWMGVVPPTPTEDELHTVLRGFLAGRDAWPSRDEFAIAGLGSLPRHMERHGGVQRWREEFGLEAAGWSEPRIEATLRRTTERLGRFPTLADLDSISTGLRSAVNDSGGLRHWAQQLNAS